jgi:dethiobiotin synthetase
MSGYFIAGTDTAVGKTRVTAGLIAGFRACGVAAGGMKPVSAGLFSDNGVLFSEDVDIIMSYSGQLLSDPELNPYRLAEPISPHIAAAHEARQIDPIVVTTAFQSLSQRYPVVVVEGAGGWLTPINEHQTMADVAEALGQPVILVVALRLGCLNHSLLTAESIARFKLPLAGWVANRVDDQMAEIDANIATLSLRLGSEPLAVLPYSHSLRSAFPALQTAAATLLQR